VAGWSMMSSDEKVGLIRDVVYQSTVSMDSAALETLEKAWSSGNSYTESFKNLFHSWDDAVWQRFTVDFPEFVKRGLGFSDGQYVNSLAIFLWMADKAGQPVYAGIVDAIDKKGAIRSATSTAPSLGVSSSSRGYEVEEIAPGTSGGRRIKPQHVLGAGYAALFLGAIAGVWR
jgi:hypothetical protein